LVDKPPQKWQNKGRFNKNMNHFEQAQEKKLEIKLGEGGENKEETHPESREEYGSDLVNTRILEMWREHKDKVQGLIQIEKMSPEEIASKEGINSGNLDSWLHGRAVKFSEGMGDEIIRKYDPLTEDLYNLFAYSKENPSALEKYPWLKNLRSFEDFCSEYCPQATAHGKALMAADIQSFMELMVHPSRERRDYSDGKEKNIYMADGNWILLPNYDYSEGTEHLAEKGVILEIIDLIKRGYHQPDYSHQTGSVALEGIGKQQAILNAREVLKKNAEIKTGEFNSCLGSRTEGNKGHESVYADIRGPYKGYNTIRWFDEYFIGFGINKKRQEKFLKSTDFRYKLSDGSEGLSQDFGIEGTLIGHKVPLSAVDTVYCWKKYYDEMKDWAAKNCPHASLASLEAVQILQKYGNIVNTMALQEKISPEEAWAKLLEK